MKKNEILMSVAHKKQLGEEFGKTYQSVCMTLKYVFNGDEAVAMRARAKELLQEEINKIDE